MTQKPRPADEPILTKWLLTRYCLVGLYVGLATVGVFVGHYVSQGVSMADLSIWSKCGASWIPSGGPEMCNDLFQGSGRMLPQTLALTTLVCIELLQALLSAVSMDNSIFQVSPTSNPWLILGVTVPFLLHLLVVYSSNLGIPALGRALDWCHCLSRELAYGVTIFASNLVGGRDCKDHWASGEQKDRRRTRGSKGFMLWLPWLDCASW